MAVNPAGSQTLGELSPAPDQDLSASPPCTSEQGTARERAAAHEQAGESEQAEADKHGGADEPSGAESASLGDVLREEFARLAQRELTELEEAVVWAALEGRDVWASGHDPEALPTLAVALGVTSSRALGSARPVLFLSPEEELLRARQVRFGARAATHLLDVAADPKGAAELVNGKGGEPGVVLWCTLESLREPSIRQRLAQLAPAVLFVESAHAASPLAHEIRPALALVPGFRTSAGQPPVVALTRGAPAAVQEDASARLSLQEPKIVRAPLVGDTQLSVLCPSQPGRPRGAELLALVERLPRPTVLFCATPQQADATFAELSAAQVPVHRYHGAMSATERATEMLHFTLPGRRAVMVATSAFGPASGLAGIDAGTTATPEGLGLGYCKQKARSLVHLHPPACLEQYALELSILTAEEPTEVVSFFDPAALEEQAHLLGQIRVRGEQLELLGDQLRAAKGAVLRSRLERVPGLGRQGTRRALRFLEDAGVVRVSDGDDPRVERVVSADALAQVVELLAAELRQLAEGDVRRLEEVRDFLAGGECRKAALERALGAGDAPKACGVCDVCANPAGGRVAPTRERIADSAAPPVPRRRASARSWSVASPDPAVQPIVVERTLRSRQARVP